MVEVAVCRGTLSSHPRPLLDAVEAHVHVSCGSATRAPSHPAAAHASDKIPRGTIDSGAPSHAIVVKEKNLSTNLLRSACRCREGWLSTLRCWRDPHPRHGLSSVDEE